jgi:DNA-directed RNA polymerase I, II, and III subunit RPABC1
MHSLQPKHTKLKSDEIKKLLEKYNISVSQLPRIKADDAALPEGCIAGDVISIERKFRDKINVYYRVVA